MKILFWRKEPKDNPPPGGYYENGEWNDPNTSRGFNVDPDDPEKGARLRRQWFVDRGAAC